jgi:catechol 2,3-dioxygenase-like lactoylglutathione lyase family enzyme
VTVSLKSIGALSLFVEDPQVSKAFYRQVFDVSVVFEDEYSVVVEFDNTIVNLLKSSAAHELIEPAMVAGPDIGHRFQLTVWVDDVDAAVVDLRARGVTLLNGPMDRVWGQRTASFEDPDGTIWEIAQQIAGLGPT